MRRSVRAVLDRLVDEGLTPAGADDTARAALAPELADHLPWYLRAAVAVGAWLATTFLLFSMFAIAGIRDEGPATVVGAVLLGGGIVLRRRAVSEFMRWSAVALSLAGLGMITFGIGELGNSAVFAAAACLVLSCVLIWFSPDTTLRFLCTLTATSGMFVWLIGVKTPYALEIGITVLVVALAYVWRVKLVERTDSLTETLLPVGYGLVIAAFVALLVRTLATWTHRSWTIDMSRDVGAVGPLATVVCTAALVALAWRVLDEHGSSLSSPASFAALGGAVALGGVTLDSPGIVAGVAMLMLAFDRRNRVLLGMAAIFLIAFGSFYYYSLQLTLLAKSGVLVGSGLIMLGVREKVMDG